MNNLEISKRMKSCLTRNLIFVHGKGGVGKTAVSQAIALSLSQNGDRTLWITLEDPTCPPGERKKISATLDHLNCDFHLAFEEYAALKIKVAKLTQLFLKNKVMQYLAKAAPGIHELVLLGKIWHERLLYRHVVVDLQSTGYGLAMFQSAKNFSSLFRSGPLYKDAEAMLETFHNPLETGHLIVSLPEETPLRESLELNDHLKNFFPNNPAAFLVNRLFPYSASPNEAQPNEAQMDSPQTTPLDWPTPVASSLEDYARKRIFLEKFNLRLWKNANIQSGELPFIIPPTEGKKTTLSGLLADQLKSKAYL